ITDVDTSVTLPVGLGELYDNRVVDVTPSRQGKPGELTGDFVFHAEAIGTVEINSKRGIFGHAEIDGGGGPYPEGLPVAAKGEAHTGAATLLTTVDEAGTKEYACEVVRLNPSDRDGRRMVIRVTDEALLNRTGGIVQGMSGSPIIQDGRLIGAVTHVMINDPALGYGIGIDEMLEAAA
ncbi:MAG: SpoIVB peptidase, partial [Clostridia bacterium]|nr:SpoIVB peptidase [Clostridia bacterium]